MPVQLRVALSRCPPSLLAHSSSTFDRCESAEWHLCHSANICRRRLRRRVFGAARVCGASNTPLGYVRAVNAPYLWGFVLVRPFVRNVHFVLEWLTTLFGAITY